LRRTAVALSIVTTLIASGAPPHGARAALPDGIWLFADKLAIRAFDCGGLLCGQVVWLRNPALRTRTMCGRTAIWGLQPTGPGQWSGGWLYDPENGKTYNVSAELTSVDVMTARVYEGLRMFGRTEVLRRIPAGSLEGWC